MQGAPMPGLFHPAAYRVEGGEDLRGGGSGDAVAMIAAGTRKGVYDGLCDFYHGFSGEGAESIGGGAGGILRASYGPAWRGGDGDPGERGGTSFPSRAGAMGHGNAVGNWWTPDRMRHAEERLQKEAGLSEIGAAGLVARWAGVEAAGGPASRNPRSGAFGIASDSDRASAAWRAIRISTIRSVMP